MVGAAVAAGAETITGPETIRMLSLFRIVLLNPQLLQKYVMMEVVSNTSAASPKKKLPIPLLTLDLPRVPIF